ncbi:MAG: manganese efflux pump [Lachnospiraceae bacterium]|nr:manganese efflux pump [Lachnospiraceae bacterium]
MGIIGLILLAVGLSMDAFAVSICKGLETKRITIKECLLCGIWFGGFQGLMPFLGYLLGTGFESVINKIAPWLAFALLAIIGINMLREAFSKEEEETKPGFNVKTMFLMAVATSIDALAVGITFVAVPVEVLPTSAFINTLFGCALIAAVTFAFSTVGVRIGNVFGARYRSGAEAAGGFVLLFIGLKILLEHFGVIDFMSNGDVLFGLLIPFAGTVVGSACVFVINDRVKEGIKLILSGMAGGIMMACSMWALLYPQVQAGRILVTALGFITGIAFQYLLDKAIPHTHVFLQAEEGPQTKLGYSGKVVLSEIIHHIPEGMAVGAVYAGFLIGTGDMTLAVALALTLGIAIQNIPEGAFVSAPLRFRGQERGKSFLMGVISGVVEPILGIATVIMVCAFPGILPFVMTFAGGAMTFLVIEETIPSMIAEKHSDKGTLSFAVFFTLMMVLTFVTRS